MVGVLTADKPDSDAQLDTGSLLGDLHARADCVGEELPTAIRFLTSVALAANHDAELAASFHEHGVPVIRRALDGAVERAVQRGELRADHPALHHLVPVLLAPHVVTGQLLLGTVSAADLHDYIDTIIAPLLDLTPAPKAT